MASTQPVAKWQDEFEVKWGPICGRRQKEGGTDRKPASAGLLMERRAKSPICLALRPVSAPGQRSRSACTSGDPHALSQRHRPVSNGRLGKALFHGDQVHQRPS